MLKKMSLSHIKGYLAFIIMSWINFLQTGLDEIYIQKVINENDHILTFIVLLLTIQKLKECFYYKLFTN